MGLLPAPGCGEPWRVAYLRDITWHHPEAPWTTPIRTAPTEPPREIYVPMPQPVPVAAPSPAPGAAPPAPAPAATPPPPQPPTPMSNSPAPIPPRVSRKLEYERCVEMPWKKRGETCAQRDALREYAHRHGLPLDHAATVSMLKGESTNEIVRQHGASKTRRTFRSRMHRTYPHQIVTCPMSRSRLMQTYGDNPYIKSSVVFYRLVPLRRGRHSN